MVGISIPKKIKPSCKDIYQSNGSVMPYCLQMGMLSSFSCRVDGALQRDSISPCFRPFLAFLPSYLSGFLFPSHISHDTYCQFRRLKQLSISFFLEKAILSIPTELGTAARWIRPTKMPVAPGILQMCFGEVD